MKVHIIGAGPSGISLAWALSHQPYITPILYDRQKVVGGSWVEYPAPPGERELHAWRLLFKNASPNTRMLFKQMGLRWDDYFTKANDSFVNTLLQNTRFPDVLISLKLYFETCFLNKHKDRTLKQCTTGCSSTFKDTINRLCYHMDGVGYHVMTCYEFFKAFDYVGLSRVETQRGNGYAMCKDLEKALLDRNIEINYEHELYQADIPRSSFFLKDKTNNTIHIQPNIINDEYVILCIDAKPLRSLLPESQKAKIPTKTIYGSISITYTFDKDIEQNFNHYDILMKTKYKLIVTVLPDKRSICCVICDMKRVIEIPPKILERRVWDMMTTVVQLPMYVKSSIHHGSHFDEHTKQWTIKQSSNVIGTKGAIHRKLARNVYACGMMTERNTPYASIEAACESGFKLAHEVFNCKGMKPKTALTISSLVVLFLIILLFYYFLKKVKIKI